MGRQVITRDDVELMVETGTASILVDKCVHNDGKRNAEIFLQPDHLKNPIRGWLDTHDANLKGRFQELVSKGGRCAYRIEVERTEAVDATLPWDQVPQTDRFRRLVGLAMTGDLGKLVEDMNVLASVGAATGEASADSGVSAPPAAPTAPAPAKTAPPATGGNPALCAGCSEPIGTRPCRRVGQNWIHTDTPCLEAPFTDTPATAGETEPDADYTPADGERDLVDETGKSIGRIANTGLPGEGPVYHCTPCGTLVALEGKGLHDAGSVHQGKARQVDQAATLAEQAAAIRAKQRQDNVADASRFDEAPTPVKLGPVPLPSPKGYRLEEGKPWEKHNSDGSTNWGNYAMQANIAGVNWAQRILIDRARIVAGETGAPPTIDPDQLRALARTLLRLSDRIQASVRDDGRFDRMDNSHARARSALATALKVYPVPFGVEPDAKAAWMEDVVAWAVLILRMAAELDA